MTDPDRPMLLRTRLLGRLARRHDRTVTMVVAGAGFGKTTLVRQMLSDPSPGPSTTDLLVRLRTPGPDADGLTRLLAEALDTPQDGADLDRLVDRIWARSPEHIAIVIDDVHHLAADAALLLHQLHERLPRNGHLVLVGRSAPFTLPQRALIDGSADLLGEDELAFDDDEVHAFGRLRGAPLANSPPETATRWPALLELERASGRAGVLRYLVEELLGSLDAPVVAFLRRVALYSPIDDAIIDAVAESAAVDEPGTPLRLDLDDIRAALPMTTRSDDGGSLIIHDLVREALVDGVDADERTGTLRRVAAVVAERGEHEAAVRLFEETGDLDAIERIARTLVDDLLMRNGTDANRRLLDELRRPLGDRMVLDALDGILTLLDHPERARPLLERAAERSRADGDEALETLCVLRLADDAYCSADHAALDRHVARVRELAETGSSTAQRLMFAAEAWQLSLARRHSEVVELVGALLDGVLDPRNPEDRVTYDFALFTWVIHRAYAGHIRDALARADAVRELPDGLYANRLAGFELIQRWQLGELTAGERASAVALVDRIESMGQAALFVEGAATTALFHASAGDVATASSLLERAERHVGRLPRSAWPTHTVAQCRAVLQVMAGDEERAAATLRASLPERGVAGLPRFVYGATAAVSYVLLPETRPVWDAETCGPDHELCFAVAHALVAVRERNDGSLAAALPWGELERLRPWAYEPHLAELAVAASEAGVRQAAAVFGELRHDPQRHLSALAEHESEARAQRAAEILRTVPRRPTEPVRCRVLGSMQLWRNEVPVDDDTWLRRQRVRDLFGFLAQHRTVERTDAAAAIWPDKSPTAASGNLRYTLNQLLAVLEPGRDSTGSSWHVRSAGSQLQLVVDDVLMLDVDEFRSNMAAARLDDADGDPGRALDRYARAIELYAGPYLADVSDDRWAYLERLRLQGDLVDAVTRSVDLLVAADELQEAERLATIGVEVEPLNERAVAALAGVLLARRRIGAAREVVDRVVRELVELDMEPEPVTRDLAARLGLISS